MSVKMGVSLTILSYMSDGLKLVDHAGENVQEIRKPLIMSSREEGIGNDVELKGSVNLTPEQIADLVSQAEAGRALVVVLTLSD